MLRPRWQKAINNLWLNKARTLLAIISIAVGVFAMGTIMATRAIAQRNLTANDRDNNPAHTVLYFTSIDKPLADTVREMPGIADAEPRQSTTIKGQSKSGEWVTLFVQVIQDFDNQTISTIESESGAWPPGRGEVLFDRGSMEYIGINIGDPIRVEMQDGQQFELEVAGTAYDMDTHDAASTHRVYAYITPETANWLGLPDGFNELYIIFDGENLTREEIRDASSTTLNQLRADGIPATGMWVRELGQRRAQDLSKSMLIILGVLGGLALIVSAFLVVNTITAMLSAQKRQIGMMKAVKARGKQIAQIYLTTITIYGLSALLIAVPLGALGTWLLSGYIARGVYLNLNSYYLPPQVIAVQVGIALLVPVIAGLFPIISAIRVTQRL